MKSVTVRFYAELNDFLPPERMQRTFEHSFSGQPAVKDLIESLGVPHTEVDLILINGASAGFSQRISDGDRISVYPVFESVNIAPLTKVRPAPLRRLQFVLDTHLGRLATYLRMLGFDTLYRNDYPDEELAEIASEQKRVLLTRDRGLLKRNRVTHGYYVREEDPFGQLVEVLRRFDLYNNHLRPFRRCLHCNSELESVSKDSVQHLLPTRVSQLYQEFKQCQGCQRVFWKGTHYERMQEMIEHAFREAYRGNNVGNRG